MLGAIGGYLVVQYESSESGPPRCVVTGADDEEPLEVEPEMARNAATIGAVAASERLPERAVTIALATAMQESGLRNIDYGDRDSVGLFQQRPSKGWGTVEQIMDPVYSAGRFYEGLVEVPDYERLPLTQAAQKVQRSGFPDAYAKHEPMAAQLSAALTGRRPAALNCTGDAAARGASDEQGAPDPARVRERIAREFGKAAPDTESGSGAGRGAPASDVVIPVPADEGARRGWELAHWALANAFDLSIERVWYRNHVWDAANSADGWRENDASAGREVRLTLVQQQD